MKCVRADIETRKMNKMKDNVEHAQAWLREVEKSLTAFDAEGDPMTLDYDTVGAMLDSVCTLAGRTCILLDNNVKGVTTDRRHYG